ncbi:MAG: YwpF family protein [Solibacillus sp.]|uniref:YwpF family protein n=1 Tax=Solibacillus sp. TaxID=1909654 RepID=UPI00331461F6
MKTFKMLSFDLFLDGENKNFPLIDGIIINQENSHQTWVLEVYTSSEYREVFNDYIVSGELLEARAVISLPDNEPAPFSVVVHSLTDIGDKISVLLKGRLKAQRKKYAEQLLSNLLKNGLRNDELLEAFEKGMRERPSLKERNEKLENLQGSDKLT